MIGAIIKEQYRILELIGEGAMGIVYMALDLELERRVALKFLKAELGDNTILIQRFRDELKTLAGFNHPNITTLFTSTTWEGHPVMVMELVEGETLQKMVDRRGPIPAEVCVPLVNQALAGVGSAHRKKVIHRDLKPANLMLNVDGVVKVMDFGIAKIQNTPGLTRTNTGAGTLLYMAPEQIRGSSADARTDIYAMGVTLYELLAGRVPFLGGSQYEIEHAHIQQQPEPPTAYYPHIPRPVVDAVLKALAKDPAERFQTAEEFAAALGGGRFSVAVAAPHESAAVAPPAAVDAPAATGTVSEEPRPRESAAETARAITEVASAIPKGSSGRKRHLVTAVSAAVLVLTAGGFGIHALRDPSKIEPGEQVAGSGGGVSQSPSAPGENESRSHGIDTEPPRVEPQHPQPGPDAPPPPAPPKPRKGEPPRVRVAPAASIVAGEWSGSYDRCEDDRSTRVAMSLTEPAPGQVAGQVSFA
ncbi:MAG: protein kinase, partial [Acidobacteriia bacterium]|nr:protein kinase [Terriglobia bacterium]